MRRRSLSVEQTGPKEAVKRRRQLRLAFARDRSQKRMRKLASDRRTDLRRRLRVPQPVEPRHQGSVQAGGNRRAGQGMAAASCIPSPSASNTALVISSTNNGMPSVRSHDVVLDRFWDEPVAEYLVN